MTAAIVKAATHTAHRLFVGFIMLLY